MNLLLKTRENNLPASLHVYLQAILKCEALISSKENVNISGLSKVQMKFKQFSIFQENKPTRCNLVIEFIIPPFIEGSTCFERHTVHHQEF
jgi:hypothetical protein